MNVDCRCDGASAMRRVAVVVLAFPLIFLVGGDDMHVGKIHRHQRIGLLRGHLDGVRIDFLEGLTFGVEAEAGSCVWMVAGAVCAKQHIIGIEIRPIMEFDAFAELELPSGIAERFPRRCQAW